MLPLRKDRPHEAEPFIAEGLIISVHRNPIITSALEGGYILNSPTARECGERTGHDELPAGES
jgi:hypothetical protein